MTSGPFKYYEDYIKKKEGRNKWTEYWAVVHGAWILFYTESTTLNRDNFRGSLELTCGTKCSIGKRRSYSFPFYISTARGTHLFKCPNNLKRYQWMYVIALAIKGDPPSPPPSYITSYHAEVTKQDVEVFQPEVVSDRASDDESDDDSLPPGVVLVTELSDGRNEVLDEEKKVKESALPSVLPGITLTTNISGYTHIGNQTPATRDIAESTSSFLLRTTEGSVSISNRPKSSPSQRRAVNGSLSPNSGSLLFSRHMGHSSPNVKMLATDSFPC